MKKKIISITSGKIQYTLGQAAPDVEGRIVGCIEFKRDGIYGINKGTKNEAYYAVSMENPMTDRDIISVIIPFDKMEKLIVMDVEDDKDDNNEIADRMQKVE